MRSEKQNSVLRNQNLTLGFTVISALFTALQMDLKGKLIIDLVCFVVVVATVFVLFYVVVVLLLLCCCCFLLLFFFCFVFFWGGGGSVPFIHFSVTSRGKVILAYTSSWTGIRYIVCTCAYPVLDWLQTDLKQFFINESYHILVASLTLMVL